MSSKYEEVAADLRQRILSGEYEPGGKLPRYEDLTVHYGVGRGVISEALALLQREGLVRSVKRLGTVVQDIQLERRRITRGNLVARDPRRGYVFPAAAAPDEPWTVHGQPKRAFVPAPSRVAECFGLEEGAEVLRRRRVTSPAGEPPFQLVDTWISPSAVEDAPQAAEPSTGPGGYLDRLEEAGHGPLSWRETTRARMPSREEAQLLKIPSAAPVLELTLVGTSAKTLRPIEVTIRVIPSDRVEIVSQLRRAPSAQWPVEPVGPEGSA
ncbi:GntR family transcriptional regulator [Streptomyces sp. B1866]|uniref:GntR family transcriptional regulator n=1 Tax=Streptomyces sp. B1866 TaxID=3075431 RepID=UPI0028911F11|nr:GntR family transcriptional regulator [Streptomyces sp. B1866]MDT3396998.1 GntR family transcriptional regulator [Streptomyces sp. B1866]